MQSSRNQTYQLWIEIIEINCVFWRKKGRRKEVKKPYDRRSWKVGLTERKMSETAAQHFIIIANCVANVALAFVAISGNALVLYGVWKAPAPRSPSTLVLCALASTDLLVGSVAQLFFIVRSFISLYSQSESLKQVIIEAYTTVGITLCATSLFIIAGISIDRLIAIVKPLQYPSIVISSRVTRFLVVIWAVSALSATTLFWGTPTLFALIPTGIFISLIICIICHATVYKIMRRHRLQIHSQIQAFEDANARTSMASLRKSAFNAFVVFIVLVICYFPHLVVYIVYFIGKAGDLELGFLLSSTVVFSNSALNPLLYCWRIREIRLAMLQTFRKLVLRE